MNVSGGPEVVSSGDLDGGMFDFHSTKGGPEQGHGRRSMGSPRGNSRLQKRQRFSP